MKRIIISFLSLIVLAGAACAAIVVKENGKTQRHSNSVIVRATHSTQVKYNGVNISIPKGNIVIFEEKNIQGKKMLALKGNNIASLKLNNNTIDTGNNASFIIQPKPFAIEVITGVVSVTGANGSVKTYQTGQKSKPLAVAPSSNADAGNFAPFISTQNQLNNNDIQFKRDIEESATVSGGAPRP